MKTTLTKLVAALLLGMVTMAASAQRGYQVKGIVVDDEGPVAGATVVEQGTINGVSTGADGAFTLTVGGADVLVEVSCIGYTTVVSKASLLPQIVTLTPDNEYLDEVVVIGYGEVRKSDLTGSVVAMKPSELNRVKANTPEDLLLGKIAGLQITQGSGSAGSTGTPYPSRGHSPIFPTASPWVSRTARAPSRATNRTCSPHPSSSIPSCWTGTCF